MSAVKMPDPAAYRSKLQPYLICLGGPPSDADQWDALITTTQAQAYADARVKEVQQWISVKDEMPPDDDTLVLALHAGDEPEVVFGFLLHETLDTWAYTHWMHIPPLPGPASHNHP